ncbi:GH25 family lysozyme [Clostridium pasteurianum]|uniref:Lysozyme M1 (1,4-beta-N-acetylmuramidase) n=1 Tax=Clostridium pasteurianum BC1 TaxID=86416 RepID=R4K2T6_CLOPA|nr:GH25 family lysozyme [Clostridium pasteurianum]AGK97422.1 lysozyme M1 (1,4-beta-N-acetylmuramidase) [Clostridium pasteurianum BC1]
MGFKGIDIYSGTLITDWNAIKNAGVEAVYIKATEGLTYVNTLTDTFYKAAKALGLKVGFYHFAARNIPAQEYQHFIDTISKYHQDLKPVLDYEVANPDMSFVAQFMALNANLLLYAAHNVADQSNLPKNKIWIAEPGANSNNTKGYAGLQHSWTGRIPGMTGDVDVDLFSSDVLIDSNNVVLTASAITQPVQQGDPSVRIIQLQLNTLLKKGLIVDSFNGPVTTAAIKEFQGIMGLAQDGIWGTKTAGAVGDIYSRPVDGVPYPHYEYATRYIQMRVGATIDGTFDNGTKVAVQNWQARHGLVADGVVGAVTWSKMLDENV